MKLMRKIGLFQLTTSGLRLWGMIFLLLSAVGAMMQQHLLGSGNMTNLALLNAMEADPTVMAETTVALILQAIGSSALPIFCLLLVEGALNTSHYGKYCLRVLGLAAVTQLPYNLLVSGNLLVMTKLNPVFAMVLCMLMLYFFRQYREKKASHIALKILAVVCIFAWSLMLGVDHGPCCVIVTVLLWALRDKPNTKTFLGIFVLFGCSFLFSMYYIVAPVGFLAMHFYEGKQGNDNRVFNYIAYPLILLITAVSGMIL